MNSNDQAAAAPACNATDSQLAAWMAQEHGEHFTAPVEDDDLDAGEVLVNAICVLADHHASHPVQALALWPAHRPGELLITASRPAQGRLCVLAVPRRSFGATMQQALGELLRAARVSAARLDAAGTGRTPPPGPDIPEAGAVLAYDAATVAEGVLDGTVHELFSRQASQVNNDGPLAQMACLITQLGPAGAQQEIPCAAPGTRTARR
jgi:hypothetical protein